MHKCVNCDNEYDDNLLNCPMCGDKRFKTQRRALSILLSIAGVTTLFVAPFIALFTVTYASRGEWSTLLMELLHVQVLISLLVFVVPKLLGAIMFGLKQTRFTLIKDIFLWLLVAVFVVIRYGEVIKNAEPIYSEYARPCFDITGLIAFYSIVYFIQHALNIAINMIYFHTFGSVFERMGNKVRSGTLPFSKGQSKTLRINLVNIVTFAAVIAGMFIFVFGTNSIIDSYDNAMFIASNRNNEMQTTVEKFIGSMAKNDITTTRTLIADSNEMKVLEQSKQINFKSLVDKEFICSEILPGWKYSFAHRSTDNYGNIFHIYINVARRVDKWYITYVGLSEITETD